MSALPAAAQTGRVGGTVKDDKGQPIKGATVVAENPAASPSSFTATTDDKGRYSIIGLRSGNWKITASAPGFPSIGGKCTIRTIGAPNPPVDFTLPPGAPAPTGALAGVNTKELQAELAKAEELMNGEGLRRRHRRLQGHPRQGAGADAINLQIGRAYRLQEGLRRGARDLQEDARRPTPNERAREDRDRHDAPREGRLRGGGDGADPKRPRATSASREVFYNLGEVKFAKGETDEADEVVPARRRTWTRTGASRCSRSASAKLQKGDTPSAIEHHGKVIAVDPSSQEAALAKAMIEQLKKG